MLLINPYNQEYITSVESISDKGKIMLLILILYKILILEKEAEENDLEDDILLVMSPTRYLNNELALQ